MSLQVGSGRKEQATEGTRINTREEASGISEEAREKAREGRATENMCGG
jgi:urease gamma subunit